MKILGEISAIETIAEERGIRELAALQQRYGQGNRRKRKGIAVVELLTRDGSRIFPRFFKTAPSSPVPLKFL